MSRSALDELNEGGQLLLWGVRHWMIATLQLRVVPPSVHRTFEVAGGAQLCDTMADMLLLAARDADRPLLVFPPCSQELSVDEERLTSVLAAMTTESSRATRLHWQALLGGEPSSALVRCARIVVDAFRRVGLGIGWFEEPADRPLRASLG